MRQVSSLDMIIFRFRVVNIQFIYCSILSGGSLESYFGGSFVLNGSMPVCKLALRLLFRYINLSS